MKQLAVIQWTNRSKRVEAFDLAARPPVLDLAPCRATDRRQTISPSMPSTAMPPIQRKVTSWKWRHSRPSGCSNDVGPHVRNSAATLDPPELAQ